MSIEVKLPKLGEQDEAGTILTVLVGPGDHVEVDQPIVEIESDKATVEVPCPEEGTVEEVLVGEGDEVRAGSPLLTLSNGADGAEEDDSEREAEERAEREAPASEREEDEPEKEREEKKEKKEKKEKRGKEEKKPSAKARQPEGDEKRERDGAKKEKEREKPKREERQERRAREEERESEETSADEEETGAERPRRAAKERDDDRNDGGGRGGDGRPAPPRREDVPAAAPTVRRLARELGVDVAEVAATGAGARVTEEDVKSHVRALLDRARAAGGTPVAPALPDLERWGEVERVPMSAVRRATARNLARSWQRIPHVTQSDRADVTEIEAFRTRAAPEVEAAGGKLTLTAIVIEVVASALRRFERFNAALDIGREEHVLRRSIHVGVAVDAGHGLLVPVIRDADRKDLTRIAVELGELATRARARELPADAMAGATFTVTNLGGLGTTHFSPIVPWPQVAILGVGRARMEPVHRDGGFVPRRILPLSLSYDHRAVDGADAARFLRWIARALEEPMRLALDRPAARS